MKLFITGASGYVGTAVTRELLEAGHQVLGLARSDKSADALKALGADVHRGDLDDLDSLRAGAMVSDGVIHLAYMHDFANIARGDAADLLAIKTLLAALEGSNKPFVGTSGTLMIAALGYLGTENDAGPTGMRRVAAEDEVISMAKRGVRSSVVRLSPTVHSDVDKHGFIRMLVNIAREKGVSAYVGEGKNRWPAVHLLDAAHLFRLAVEGAPAGTRLHAVGEEGIPFRDIAEAIGHKLNVPVSSITADKAAEHFGFLGALVSIDNPTSSELSQKLLGWKPNGPTLMADLETDSYFKN